MPAESWNDHVRICLSHHILGRFEGNWLYYILLNPPYNIFIEPIASLACGHDWRATSHALSTDSLVNALTEERWVRALLLSARLIKTSLL